MDNNNIPKEEVADFSSYMNKPAPVGSEPQNISPIQEYKKSVTFTNRLKYLMLFLAFLAVAQIVLIIFTKKDQPSGIPEGYRLITPTGQPSYIEPIK